MSKFLTLEGDQGNPRRVHPLFSGLLDAPRLPRETAATRAAFAARQEAAAERASDEAERQTESYMKRLEAMTKSTDEGADPKKDLFTSYEPPKAKNGLEGIMSIGEDMAEGEGLEGWKRLRRAFTPPAKVRRALKRVRTPPKVLKKAIRYAGAAQFMVLTGGFAGGKMNKMFGISPSEQKFFNIASKITRATAIAVATVAGGPAIISGMSKVAGGAMTKFLGKTAFTSALGKGGKFLMKDAVKGEIWSFTKNAAGALIGQKFNKNQVTPDEYAALPDNTPVPVPSGPIGGGGGGGGGGASSGGGFAPEQDDSAVEPEMAPSVAGSTSMTPGSQETPPGYKDGEFVDDPATRVYNSKDNPLGSYSRVDPLLDDNSEAIAAFDESSIEEMKQTGNEELPPSEEMTPTDEPLSLAFEEALARARCYQRDEILRSKNGNAKRPVIKNRFLRRLG